VHYIAPHILFSKLNSVHLLHRTMSSFFKSFRSSKRPSQLPSTWSNDHSHDGRDDLPVVSFPTPTHYVPTPEGSYSQPTNSDARDHAEVLRLQQDLQTAQERIRNLEDRMWELMQENQALKTQVTANATAGGTPHDDSGQAQTTSHANEEFVALSVLTAELTGNIFQRR